MALSNTLIAKIAVNSEFQGKVAIPLVNRAIYAIGTTADATEENKWAKSLLNGLAQETIETWARAVLLDTAIKDGSTVSDSGNDIADATIATAVDYKWAVFKPAEPA